MKLISKIILISVFVLSTLTGCNPGHKQVSGSNELTIATFLDNLFLEYAARKYEETHEGVTIKIDVYSAQNERDVEKYSQIINTALMSGGGADIIDVCYINRVMLADNNRLLDLNGKITLSPEDYYQNILDAFLYNGKRYAIPLCFNFSALRFDKAFADIEIPESLTLGGLMALADEYPENPLFLSGSGMGAVSLTYKLFGLDFNSFIDLQNKEAHIDNEKFISLLENINSLSNLRVREQGETALIWEFTLYTPIMDSNTVEDYTGIFLLTNDEGEGLFEAYGLLPAVNANSANQELAVDFMRFLLSEEIQSSPELMFNPVNKKASLEIAALKFTEYQAAGYIPDGFDLERNIRLFNELAEKLTVVEYSDSFVTQFIRDELTRYFNGEVSAEQAAKNLQSRLNTYLKE